MKRVFILIGVLAISFSACSRKHRQVTPPPSLNDFAAGLNTFFEKDPEFPAINQTGNNRSFSHWGSQGIPLLQFANNFYSDGFSTPTDITRDPSDPRKISNTVHSINVNNQPVDIRNKKNASDFLWLWGQFVDHDMDLTELAPSNEHFDISVPTGDPLFDPLSTGTKSIPLRRSNFTTINGIRFQLNSITAFLDASNVYGSEESRTRALRKSVDGKLTAYLKSDNGYLPLNRDRLMNEPADNSNIDPTTLFVAGDVRANENVALAAMHTLFMREHNFIVDHIRKFRPDLDEESIFQLSRLLVASEIQAITFREFLPILLGSNAIPPYTGYDHSTNPGIHSFFSTVAFRVGHTMVSPFILRRDSNGNPIPAGDLALRNAFFRDVPTTLQSTGLEPLFIGLNLQKAQAIDILVIDDLRNFLFGSPGSGGLDLASINIQRARDHGLPPYNEARKQLGLFPAHSFSQISQSTFVQNRLANAYAHPDDVDPWTGGLAEDHVAGALVGPLFWTSIRDQFTRVRNGDRFWYQNVLPSELQRWVESSTLSEIIRRNTNLYSEIPDNIFISY